MYPAKNRLLPVGSFLPHKSKANTASEMEIDNYWSFIGCPGISKTFTQSFVEGFGFLYLY